MNNSRINSLNMIKPFITGMLEYYFLTSVCFMPSIKLIRPVFFLLPYTQSLFRQAFSAIFRKALQNEKPHFIFSSEADNFYLQQNAN